MQSARIYKIAVIGPKGSGKSRFLQRCRQNLHAFDSRNGTVPIPLHLTAEGHWVNFCVVPSDQYHNPNCWQYAGADGIIAVYSAESDFEETKEHMKEFCALSIFPVLVNAEVVVLLTQMDVSNAQYARDRVVPLAFARFCMHFVSSQTGDGVAFAVESLVGRIVRRVAA